MVDALAAKGILAPFPIQEQTIPLALDGQDIIGQAKTGTGKTFGFGLPLIQRLGLDPEPGVKALVVVPTRELCVQVTEDLEIAAGNRPTKIVSIYGGKAYEGQIEQIKAGAQIVVGTPGRLLDLAGQRLLNLGAVQEMVLDEADKMLDLGFLADIEKLFAQTPANRHTMLFSATMPGPIVALARRFMNRPIHIRATDPDEGLTQANIKHLVYRAHNMDKDEVIARILQAEGRGKTVVFTRTKRAAAKLVEELNDRGFNAAAVHGDLNQEQRERAMAAFKAGKKDILIATDVAARGIDVDDVTHVINHTIPEDDKTYLHRAGRTGRAGKTGIAVTFVDWDDLHKWALINRALEFGQPEPTETYSSSPHLFSDLNIPEGTRGRLKSAGPKIEAPRVDRSGERGASRSGGRGESRGGERSGRGPARSASGPAGSAQGGSGQGGSEQGASGQAPTRRSASSEAPAGDSGSRSGSGSGSGTGSGSRSRGRSRSGGYDSPARDTDTSRRLAPGSLAPAASGSAPAGSAPAAAASSEPAQVSHASHASATESTSAGSGSEHHDGNSAPRRRSRSRRRSPRPAGE
ncbi:DEAD/DEAH box helicase [Herbiconiux liangxiaofengii]|uniref:DEAD/DEAH box helicase n=1 Tax=Herbiconiux liangxiaofengii TaxID=3342795 RepID=UPI0035B7C3FF